MARGLPRPRCALAGMLSAHLKAHAQPSKGRIGSLFRARGSQLCAHQNAIEPHSVELREGEEGCPSSLGLGRLGSDPGSQDPTVEMMTTFQDEACFRKHVNRIYSLIFPDNAAARPCSPKSEDSQRTTSFASTSSSYFDAFASVLLWIENRGASFSTSHLPPFPRIA